MNEWFRIIIEMDFLRAASLGLHGP